MSDSFPDNVLHGSNNDTFLPTANATSSTCEQQEHDPSADFAFAVDTVLGGVLILVGIVGNVLTVCTFSRFSSKSTTTVLLTALAVSDALYLLVHALLFQFLRSIYPATGAFKGYNDIFEYINKYEFPFGIMFQTLSVWLMAAVTVDRYIAVCWPLHARAWCTLRRARAQVVIAVCSAIVLNTPRFFTTDVKTVWDPCTNSSKLVKVAANLGLNPYYTWTASVIYLTLVYFAPVILLFIINIRLVVELSRARRKKLHLTQSTGESTRDVNDHVTVMLCTVVVVFIICQLPQSIDHLMYTIPITMIWPDQNYIDIYCNFLVALNASLNFFLYVFYVKKFRYRLLGMLHRRVSTESTEKIVRNFSQVQTF